MSLIVEQALNGLQLGLTLFMIAGGLTLVFGIMGVINLAHGSLYMTGAFAAAWVLSATGQPLLAVIAGLGAAALAGLLIELAVIRRLYERDHLDQVLATFGLILFMNEAHQLVFGRQPLFAEVPDVLSGTVEVFPGVPYPIYRLAMILVGLLVALGLWLMVARTRLGMLIRAAAANRTMVAAMGVEVGKLSTTVFALGATLAGLAGVMVAPLLSVEVGMGEEILILAFVTVVIGGLGSVRGAFVGALLVGFVDTAARGILPPLLELLLPPAEADGVAAGVSSMSIYLLMAAVLVARPRGLVGGRA